MHILDLEALRVWPALGSVGGHGTGWLILPMQLVNTSASHTAL